MKNFTGKAIGPVYTPLAQLDFAPEIARIRAEKPDAVFGFLVGPAASLSSSNTPRPACKSRFRSTARTPSPIR